MDQSDRIVVAKLKKIAMISLFFMTIELVGGFMAHSIAIMADAFHLLSDVIAYVISLYAVLLSKRLAPKHLGFGYQKAQPLGALINVAIIWCVTIQLFIEATHRIIAKQVVQQPLFMLLTSIFGLGCNLYIMKTLHSEEDGHSHHGHSHGDHSHGKSHELNQEKSHGDHNHDHHDHHDHHDQKQYKEYIQAICSCESPGQLNRSTKTSDNQSVKSSHKHSKQHQLPMQLGQDLVPKHKGYCAIHSNQKNSHTSNGHENHDHDHGHNHHNHGHGGCSYGAKGHGHAFENINMQAAYIHILSDIILSIGVIVSASIIFFVAGGDTQWSAWQLADPFCTYLFSIVALYSTISIIKESITILMDGCQNPDLLKKTDYFLKVLKDKHGNVQIQGLKIWSSNRGKYYCTMKVILGKIQITNSSQLMEQRQQLKTEDERQIVYQKIIKFCKSLKMTSYIDIRRN